MAEYIIQDTTLTGIGDAIREKEGSTASIPVSEMASRIKNISSKRTVKRLESVKQVNMWNSGGWLYLQFDDELPDDLEKIIALYISREPGSSGAVYVRSDGFEVTNGTMNPNKIGLSFANDSGGTGGLFTDVEYKPTSVSGLTFTQNNTLRIDFNNSNINPILNNFVNSLDYYHYCIYFEE